LARFVFVFIVAACAGGGSAVAVGAERAPAGQMCPGGSYVIGFDSESNIICSNAGKKAVLGASETSDIGRAEPADTCMGDCEPGDVDKKGTVEEIAGKNAPADPGVVPSVNVLSISDLKPSSVVFGTREIELTVNGTGFLARSVIVFAGNKYSPSVNQAGTRLVVTIPTRDLGIGPYAVTVSNGPGMETTFKKALNVF